MPRLVTALMVVGTVLSGAISAELMSSIADNDRSILASSTPQSVRPARAEVTNAQPTRAALVDAILARPLFAPKRRPAMMARSPTAPQTVTLPRLSGIVMSGEQRSAIFAADEGRRPVVAELGGRVGQYVVQAIESERVTLVGPGGTRVMQPSFDPNPHRPEPPASTVAAQAPLPFAAASTVMPSLRNLAGFGGPPVVDQAGPDRLSRLSSLRPALAPQQRTP